MRKQAVPQQLERAPLRSVCTVFASNKLRTYNDEKNYYNIAGCACYADVGSTGTLSYTITSTIEGFAPISGEITIAIGKAEIVTDRDYLIIIFFPFTMFSPFCGLLNF